MKKEIIIKKEEEDSYLDIAMYCLNEHVLLLEHSLLSCKGREYSEKVREIEMVKSAKYDLDEF